MQAAALRELLALYRCDGLTAGYPRVRQLLTQLPEEELPRIGQLLSRLDCDAVRAAHPAVRTVRMAITGHGTPVSLVPALTAQLARHGLLLSAYVGDYDSYVFELSDRSGALYATRADLTLCLLDPAIVTDELPSPWRVEDVERILTAKLRLLEGLIGTFGAEPAGVLVLNTIPLPHSVAGQLRDYRSRARLGAVWRDGNAALLRLADRFPSVVVLDLDPLVAVGHPVTDARLSTYARAQLAPPLLAAYAREIGHLARYIAGGGKKCLVLDLDNTLWGGVLGDDGAAGIEVADSYRGEAFRGFQRVLKQLGSQGVLLAAVSKNEPEAVATVLRDHPGMTLRSEDFVRVIANWRPKHENLLDLADALNLGVDSFVFVDDSSNECGQIRYHLPAVAVVELDEEPALHVEKLLRDGWFGAPEVTAEDRDRAGRYRDDLARADFLDTFASIEEYLRELRVSVELRPAQDRDVPRVAQLSMRTNQFNLTTRRLSPAEVAQLLADPAALVLCIRSRDRFGDNGLVGAIFARRDGAALHLENMVLSCRVFSRGIEQACLAAVLHQARTAGVQTVYGTYRPTAKNGTVRTFYPRYGFSDDGSDDGGTRFRHDLDRVVAVPEHVDLHSDVPLPVPEPGANPIRLPDGPGIGAS